MAKGQKRGNREIRKPKQPKRPKEATLAAGSLTPVKASIPSAKRK